MLIVLCLGMILPMPEKGTVYYTIRLAQVAQVVDVLLSSIAFVPTFLHKGLKPRPAQSKLEPGASLFGSAGRQLCTTLKKIFQSYPALKWFLISNILVGSVQSAASSIALSFMVDFMQMTTTQTSIAIFLYNTFLIIGAVLFRILSKRFCIFRALKVVILLISISFIIGSIVLRGPDQIWLMFIFIAFWSLILGWILPNTRTIYVTIIPKGQEAEMMGLYLFCSNGFVWIPTLVATSLIGSGVSWSAIIGTLSIYTFLSLVTLTFMGSYSSAKRHAVEMSEENFSADKAEEEESDEEVAPKMDCKELPPKNSSSTFTGRNSSSVLGYSDVEIAKSSTTDLQHSQEIEQSMKSQQQSASIYSVGSSVIDNKSMSSSKSDNRSHSTVSGKSLFDQIARLGRC